MCFILYDWIQTPNDLNHIKRALKLNNVTRYNKLKNRLNKIIDEDNANETNVLAKRLNKFSSRLELHNVVYQLQFNLIYRKVLTDERCLMQLNEGRIKVIL